MEIWLEPECLASVSEPESLTPGRVGDRARLGGIGCGC